MFSGGDITETETYRFRESSSGSKVPCARSSFIKSAACATSCADGASLDMGGVTP